MLFTHCAHIGFARVPLRSATAASGVRSVDTNLYIFPDERTKNCIEARGGAEKSTLSRLIILQRGPQGGKGAEKFSKLQMEH